MKPAAIITFLLLVLLSTPGSASDEITISGTIKNPAADFVTVHYFNSFTDRIFNTPAIDTISLDKKGEFVYKKMLNKPIEFYMKNGRMWLFSNKFIEPGDKFNIEVTFTDNEENYMDISGEWSGNNNFLHEFVKEFYTKPEVAKQFEFAFKKNFADFINYIDLRKEEELQFVEKNKVKFKLTNKFLKYIKAEIIYVHASDRCRYVWNLIRAYDGEIPEKVPSGYFNFIEDLHLNKPLSLANMRYPLLIDLYLNTIYDLEMMNSKEKEDDLFHSSEIKYSMARNLFSGLALDLADAGIISDHIGLIKILKPDQLDFFNLVREGFESAYSMLKKIKDSGINKDIYNKTKAYIDNEKQFTVGMPAPDFDLKDINGNDVILSELKGKVVFLNFWATYCIPCLEEMPFLIKLMDEFKGKDVEFVFIALENDSVKHKEFITNRKFTEGHHVIETNKLNSTVAKSYHLKGIPAYFIINKSGILFSADAPKPSDPRLKSILKRLSAD